VIALDELHRARQSAIRQTIGNALTGLLYALPDLSQESIDAYVGRALPTVHGGQQIAADAAAAYALALGGGRPARAANVDRALAASGVLVTSESRSIVAPMLRARGLAADGLAQAEAMQGAASYARELSSNDLQAAMRVGVGEGAASAGYAVRGWRKSLSGDACDWCQQIANTVYRDPDAVPFHAGDRCDVEPVLD
jgi:hypothetical protein